MKIPEFLTTGSGIGVTAPSIGITDELKIKRMNNGKVNLEKRGYNVRFTENMFTCDKRGRSSIGSTRAEQFNDLLYDDSISCIISAAGGDYLMEMLDKVDFEYIKNNPKWFQGYSDNTGLVYPIVTRCDVAAVYGNNFGDFGMDPWEPCVGNALKVLSGGLEVQESFDFYENAWYDGVTGYEGYRKDKPVEWINAGGEEEIKISGRLLGGCFDVLAFLFGTEFDGTKDFIEKYKDDGIIWCLESFDMADTQLITHLWQMRQMGYFKYTKGIVFGRPMMYHSEIDCSYKDTIMYALGDMNIPVIMEADLGHKGPQFSWVMGAKAEVVSSKGRGKLTIDYRE